MSLDTSIVTRSSISLSISSAPAVSSAHNVFSNPTTFTTLTRSASRHISGISTSSTPSAQSSPYIAKISSSYSTVVSSTSSPPTRDPSPGLSTGEIVTVITFALVVIICILACRLCRRAAKAGTQAVLATEAQLTRRSCKANRVAELAREEQNSERQRTQRRERKERKKQAKKAKQLRNRQSRVSESEALLLSTVEWHERRLRGELWSQEQTTRQARERREARLRGSQHGTELAAQVQMEELDLGDWEMRDATDPPPPYEGIF